MYIHNIIYTYIYIYIYIYIHIYLQVYIFFPSVNQKWGCCNWVLSTNREHTVDSLYVHIWVAYPPPLPTIDSRLKFATRCLSSFQKKNLNLTLSFLNICQELPSTMTQSVKTTQESLKEDTGVVFHTES